MLNITTHNGFMGFMGDTHGDTRTVIDHIVTLAERNVSTILHVGDAGLDATVEGWAHIGLITKALRAHNQHMYVTLGNHDNFTMFTEFDDNNVCNLTDRIHVFGRPTMFTVSGPRSIQRFLSVSGAASANKDMLTPHVNWWEEERITMGDIYRVEEVVSAFGHPDVLITHDAPLSSHTVSAEVERLNNIFRLPDDLTAYTLESRESIERVMNIASPAHLFHGHHHIYYNETCGDTRVHGLPKQSCEGNCVIYNIDTMEEVFVSPKVAPYRW